MIWVGVITVVIVGIFYTRTSIFVERKSKRRYSKWNIDQIDSLNGFIPSQYTKQKRIKKQTPLTGNGTTKKNESGKKLSIRNLLKKLN